MVDAPARIALLAGAIPALAAFGSFAGASASAWRWSPGQLVDAVIIALIGIFAIVGAARGALRGVLRIVSLLAACAVGRFAAPWIESPIGYAFQLAPRSSLWVAAIGVAVAAAVAFGIVLARCDATIAKLRVPLLDAVLGLALGIAFGVALALAILTPMRDALSPASPLAAAAAQSWSGQAAARVVRIQEDGTLRWLQPSLRFPEVKAAPTPPR